MTLPPPSEPPPTSDKSAASPRTSKAERTRPRTGRSRPSGVERSLFGGPAFQAEAALGPEAALGGRERAEAPAAGAPRTSETASLVWHPRQAKQERAKKAAAAAAAKVAEDAAAAVPADDAVDAEAVVQLRKVAQTAFLSGPAISPSKLDRPEEEHYGSESSPEWHPPRDYEGSLIGLVCRAW